MESFIHWNIDPEIINIFGLSIRYYGVLYMTGLVLCYYVLKWIFKRESIPVENLDTLSVYSVVGILSGARLGHCLFYNLKYYISHPLEMLLPIRIFNGHVEFIGYQGLASHGGVIGLGIALYLYSRKTKRSPFETLDLMAVVAGLAGGFIRLANFMNSEIIGNSSTLPWAIVFERVDNIARHPSQLYEAIVYFSTFILTIFLYKTKRDKLKNGAFFGLVITITFTARFFLEFAKRRQADFLSNFPLDMGQVLSIPFVIIGILFLFYGLKKTANPVEDQSSLDINKDSSEKQDAEKNTED